MESLSTPYLLLAAPTMRDPYFSRTVVLMGHHTREGAFGWIVNRVLEEKAPEVLAAPLNEAVHPETPLHVGGPVPTDGLVVVFRGALEGAGIDVSEVAPGLRLASTPAVLPLVFREGSTGRSPRGLLIHGYSGWGPGQLEREMKEGAWLVAPFEEALAFPIDTDGLWERALSRLGVEPGSVSATPSSVH